MTTRTVSIPVDRLQDLLDGYCGPNKTDDLYKLLEDPCKDGHMPIGWDGPVYCEVCSTFLYNENDTKEPDWTKYEQFCGRVERKPQCEILDYVGNPDALRSRTGKRWLNGVYGKFGPSSKLYRGTEWKLLGFDDAQSRFFNRDESSHVNYLGAFNVPNTGPFAFLDKQTDLPKDWVADALVRLIMDRVEPVKEPDMYGTGWYF